MTITISPPTARQQEFFRATARYVAYGGARGGGKSWALRTKAAILALYHDGITILILRRSLPELRLNHIEPLRALMGTAARWSELEKTLHIGKSRIIFGYCDTDSNLRRYQGNEYDVIFIDEATQFPFEWFEKLKACVRGANAFPHRIYLTCNPGDIGHEWVKRLFIDRSYKAGENEDDYTFIRATVYDNAPLLSKDPEYVQMLESLTEPLRSAWLEGDWDTFIGQFFSEFDRTVHVIEPFEKPKEWRAYVALDYGLDMLAAYVIALDEQGYAYVMREAYQSGLIVSDAAKVIHELCDGLEIYEYIAPPDLWNRNRDTGASAAEIFSRYGIDLVKAQNERVQGWLDMKEWLKVTTDEQGAKSAYLRICSNCRELLRTLPQLQFDSHKPCDCAREPHELTHASDAIRYFCAGRPYPAQSKTQKKSALPFALRTDDEYTGGYMNWDG